MEKAFYLLELYIEFSINGEKTMQNSNWIKYILLGLLLFNGICFSSPVNNNEQDKSIKVLVVTGIHDYDTLAFNDMFKSFNDFECTVKTMGENPGILFENVDEFPYDVIVFL